MSKFKERNRGRGKSEEGLTKEEINRISREVENQEIKRAPKKLPSVRFEMRIPGKINERVENVMDRKGYNKATIFIMALNDWLDRNE